MNNVKGVDVLDILIAFIKGCHYKNKDRGWENCIHSVIGDKDYWIWNADYLLNQLLRQVDVPPERYLLSKGAKEMWEKLKPTGNKGDQITSYYYREKLTIHNNINEKVDLYKGAENSPSNFVEIKEGNTFIYKDIFHHEHTVPVYVIKNKLLDLKDEDLTKENVKKILEKMYICRMLKSEDRSIEPKFKKDRPIEVEEVLKEVYKDIEVEFPKK